MEIKTFQLMPRIEESKAILSKVVDRVFKIYVPSQYWLAYAFMRPQEFYENPKHNNKVVLRSTLEEWHFGVFQNSYYDEWDGFNLPSSSISLFKQAYCEYMDTPEQALMKALDSIPAPFYLIGVCGDEDALMHELAHAVYGTNSDYRSLVTRILSDINHKHPGAFRDVTRILLSNGYHVHVLSDEIQAYMVTEFKDLEVPADLALQLRFYGDILRNWIQSYLTRTE